MNDEVTYFVFVFKYSTLAVLITDAFILIDDIQRKDIFAINIRVALHSFETLSLLNAPTPTWALQAQQLFDFEFDRVILTFLVCVLGITTCI